MGGEGVRGEHRRQHEQEGHNPEAESGITERTGEPIGDRSHGLRQDGIGMRGTDGYEETGDEKPQQPEVTEPKARGAAARAKRSPIQFDGATFRGGAERTTNAHRLTRMPPSLSSAVWSRLRLD
jgi:hypothetical protein